MKTETVHILCGLPGSGKSTYVTYLYSLYDPKEVFYYSTDSLIDLWAEEKEKTYSEIFKDVIGKATSTMNELLEWAKENKKVVIWDQTNLSEKKRNAIVKHFPNANEIVYHVFQVTDEILEQRLNNRPGKVIPRHVLESMKKSFEIPGIDTDESPVIYHEVNIKND